MASTGDSLKTPHSVSLKVLRLSRPSLAPQHTLPAVHHVGIAPQAALAYPAADDVGSGFFLSSVLNLPEAFGSAYVGETFSCTLCANNELAAGADTTRAVSGVRIQGEMQTPSNPSGSPLDLTGALDAGDATVSPAPGESLQHVLRFELKEEGNHVLAVTVTYTETVLGEGKAASGRVRTFRKLYQFVAQQLLSVRTKAGLLPQQGGLPRYLLEAQLENMGEAAVCIEAVNLNPRPTLRSTSLNWDAHPPVTAQHSAPILSPRDVVQVAFILDQQSGVDQPDTDLPIQVSDDKRLLGQLAIQWRGTLGDRGSLSTGWLTCRR